MKIKKEALTKTVKCADNEASYQKCPSDVSVNSPGSVLLSEGAQTRHLSVSACVSKESTISEIRHTNKSRSTPCSNTSEPWHQAGILRQALLSISSSGQMEKPEPNVDVESVLPKLRDNLLPTVDDIKLADDLPPVSNSSSNSSLAHGSFSPTADFSSSMVSLPPVSSPFPSLPFGTMSSGTLTSSCTVPSQDSPLPMMTQIQNCGVHQARLQSPSNDILTNSSTDAVPNPDTDSSVSVASVDSISSSLVSAVSSYSVSASNLCQALSSKDDAVTVVYSSIPKIEPTIPSLIHDMQKTVPLPPMSEVKSSLGNHLNVLPQSQSKPSNGDLHKVSVTLPSMSPGADSHSQALNFDGLTSNEVGGPLSTIKLDSHSNSSEFGGESSLSLSSGAVKFNSDNSSSDIASSIVIPVSSDVILTKIDGQNSTSPQDISHIITIPLPAGTIYNSSLSIPMPLPLCNGATPGTSVQMTPTVVSNLPYSITGISNQVSNPCWPNSAVALSVTSTSNSQMSTSVTTSLPVSIMSVAPSVPSVPSNSMIHFTSNSISLPTASQVASTAITSIPQDPVCYTVQSPAEILSQLSKAGVLPTMSSSQVSSVLSALGSDSHVDMESDGTNHNEILNNQVLPGEKVSTLTQTDALEMNITQHDEKIIQLLSGQHILDQHVNGSQIMMPSANQPQSINSDPALNSGELVTADVAEPKEISSPFPRIVAMVLNAPALCNEKFSVPDINVETVFKNNEIKTSSNAKSHSKHSTDSPGDSLHDFLVLPNNSKPQRKRPRRTNALREMLLGLNETPTDKEAQSKKPRGRPKKVKSDICLSTGVSDIKSDKSSNMEVVYNGDVNNASFTKEAGCYKCKCCPFLSLEEISMVSHVKVKHNSEVPEINIDRQELKCPGCPNVFFTTNSLEVHLKQDHQVNTPELKAITSTVIKVAAEGKIKLAQGKKKKKKSFNNGDTRDFQNANAIGIPNTGIVSQVLAGPSNSNVPALDVSGALIMSTNCSGVSEMMTGDKKLRVKNLDSDNGVNKSGYSFRNISVSKSKNSNDNSLHESNKKVPKTGNSALHVETVSDFNAGEKPAEAKTNTKGNAEPKRKRGRPKGSRSSTLIAGLKSSTEKDGDRSPKKANAGHRCDIDNCAVTMRSPENIEYHRACHSDAEFKCPECGHTHCHWNGMSTHLWRVHMVDMELYTCDQCNYKTVSYAKLINLHKWIHGSERPFLCDSCGKGFKNRKQLRNHKSIHQPKQTKVGECEVCGRTFTNTRMLRMHLDNVHNKLRPHLCNYCGYSASSVSSLKMHMRKHTGEKPFRCHLCDYCTADHNSLRRHKMRHTGHKPYKCPHCPYACIQSSTYKAHLKTKHPGMDDGLMFSCNLCAFRSVKEENYLAHLAEHKRDVVSSPEKLDTRKQDITNRKFDLEEPSGSVLHLVDHLGNDSNERYSIVKLGSMDSVSEVQMTLESDFETEEITGDISEAELITGDIGEPISEAELITGDIGEPISEAELITGDIGEPQEFKVCENDLKMKSHDEDDLHSTL